MYLFYAGPPDGPRVTVELNSCVDAAVPWTKETAMSMLWVTAAAEDDLVRSGT